MRRLIVPEGVGTGLFISALTFSDGIRPGPFLRTVTRPVPVPLRW
ncbi:MAG: hypothetical protein U1E76_05900 [Planctomycetota bacterium]